MSILVHPISVYFPNNVQKLQTSQEISCWFRGTHFKHMQLCQATAELQSCTGL